MDTTVENLVVGSGPSALAATMALRRLGRPVLVVDTGHDLETERQSRVDQLARYDSTSWRPEDRDFLFPRPRATAHGVEKRFAFGSDFPYRLPSFLTLETEACVVDVSHGVGGFGNVWGAAMLPWADSDLVDWPLPPGALSSSYRNVLQYVPMSGVADDLAGTFPLYRVPTPLQLSDQGERMGQALARHRRSLLRRGAQAGRARVAVDSAGGPASCRYCGFCLDGCAYGSIFNPREHWPRLEGDGVTRRTGVYALEFAEGTSEVAVTTLDVQSGARGLITTRRLFVAAGAVNSTRLVARSLGLQGEPIPLKDSQYFFFPLLSYRKARRAPAFTLAEHFVEVHNQALSKYFTHFQVYGLNSIFRQALRTVIPRFLQAPALMQELEGRFFLFQGFLHSEDSGSLEFTLDSAPAHDRVRLRGRPNPASRRIARGAQRILRRALLGFGIIPPLYLKMVPLGRSFHLGGSFPMGGAHPVLRSDRAGRPAGLKRVHLVDASTFPTIPATTITLTIMAQADRIVGEAMVG